MQIARFFLPSPLLAVTLAHRAMVHDGDGGNENCSNGLVDVREKKKKKQEKGNRTGEKGIENSEQRILRSLVAPALGSWFLD